MSKVALSMIISGKENPGVIKTCLSSIASYVDGIYITITTPKENDQLESVLKEFKVNYDYKPNKFFTTATKEDISWLTEFMGYEPEVKEGDKMFQFDKARNHSMQQIPKDYQWFIWMDADDVWRAGKNLKELVSFAETNKADCIFLNYIYQAEIKDGKLVNVIIEHLRERLMKNDGSFEWIAPIHETLIEKKPTIKIDSKLCEVLHLSNEDRRKDALMRNIKTLEILIAQTKGADPRPIYYLAKAYFDCLLQLNQRQYLDKAKKLFEIYIYGTQDYQYQNKSGWGEERSQCWEYLVEIYRQLGELTNAIKAGHNALIEDERFPSIYINIALSYLLKNEFGRALFWVKLASKIEQPKTTLISNPRDLAARTLEIIYHACINTSQLDEAWAAATKLADIFPESQEMLERVKFTNGLRQQRELTKITTQLANYLSASGETEKIKALMMATPTIIESNPIISGLRSQFIPSKVWDRDEVCIYCGPGFTTWSPKTLLSTNPNEFVGGSEEAVIYLSKELAKLGWKVTVYADPGSNEGVYDGVNYLPYYKFNKQDQFNIVVAWRRPTFVDQDIKANKIFIWCHDIQNQLDYTPERLEKITKVMVLSPWHRGNIPNVPDDKIMITGNGINF